MNVTDAIKQYQANGDAPTGTALREVINQLIDENIKTDFSNDSYLDALVLTDVMFHRCNSSVRLLTGGGGSSFLSTLKSTFVGAISRLAQSKGIARILLLDSPVPDWLAELAKAYPKTLTIRRAASPEPIRHFIVCDSNMSRHEEIHAPITDTTPATAIKARVSFNEPGRAKVLENYFDSMWETVAKFSANS